MLAKALRLPVRDFIILKDMSGLNPFEPLQADPVDTMEHDFPYSRTLALAEIARRVQASGLKIEDLDYLLRHRFDPVGKYRVRAADLRGTVKALRTGIDTIGVEHAIPADPGAMDDAVLRQKMSLALPADVVETFFGMWAGTTEYEVAVAAPPAAALDPTAFENEPAIRRVNYNTTRQEQRLVVQGVLFDPQKNALKARFPSPVLGQLLDATQARAKTFFEANLQKHAVNTETFSGFLQPTDIALFEPLAPIDEGLPEAQKQLLRQQRESQLRARRATLVVAFLPFLQEKLVRDLVLRTVAGAVPGDDALVGVLLQDAALLHDPDRPAEPLLESFTAAGERGVTATYFASVDASGGLLSSVTTPSADTALKDRRNQPFRPNDAQSVTFTGYFQVPVRGPYRFYVEGKNDASIELRLGVLADPLLSGQPNGVGQVTELKSGAV